MSAGAASALERGRALLEAGDAAGALEVFRAGGPGTLGCGRGEVAALLALGQVDAARARLEALRAAWPEQAVLTADAAVLAGHAGRPERALAHAARALSGPRPDPTTLGAAGHALMQVGRLKVAARCFDLALRLRPADPALAAGRATVALRLGRPEQAAALLDPIRRRHPVAADVVAPWARALRQVGRGAEAVEPVVAALAVAPPHAQGALGHLLGDLLVDGGAWEDGFDAHAAANRAQGGAPEGGAAARLAPLEAEAAAWGGARPQLEAVDPTTAPILIVGVPRSGTSLLERILDRHPGAVARGEREELGWLHAGWRARTGTDGWAAVQALGPAGRQAARAWTTERLGAPAGARPIDKMPANHRHLGVAAALWPGATVLWCRRDPDDVALSCFFTDFGAAQPWSRDLACIGAEQRACRTRLERAAGLGLRVYPVDYRALVTDPEEIIRATLAALGLPWEPACLRPEATADWTHTASYAQVRRPIHPGRLGRSAPLHHRLAPARRARSDAQV